MKIVQSVFITVLVALGAAYAFRNVFNILDVAILAIIFQFILSFILKSIGHGEKINDTGEANEIYEEISALSECVVVCPCGNTTLIEPIFANDPRTFMCDKCNSAFIAQLSLDIILKTEEVDIDLKYQEITQTMQDGLVVEGT